MKITNTLLAFLLFVACTKSSNNGPIKLLRTEAIDNSGNTFHTEYQYDNAGRISSVTQHENSEQPSVAVSITYSGNEAILTSSPKTDPAYDQTATVHLTLDAHGKTQKRIEYTHGVAILSSVQPAETFRYDTVFCEYDATGVLIKTTEGRYDSIWVNARDNSASRLSSTASYTMTAGNLTICDEDAIYPKTVRQAGVTTLAGGSSQYHTVFSYGKSYANRLDFTNAAVLNEYLLYYEAAFNSNYKNLPDLVVRTNTDKDINGAVIFAGTSTVDIERGYNANGLLSSVHIPSQNTPYATINYFYGH